MTAGPAPLAAWRERRRQVPEGWPHRCLVGLLAALAAAGDPDCRPVPPGPPSGGPVAS